jgi:hypothetical protein
MLAHLIYILLLLLVIRHTTRWVSYHIHHCNKKARVFHGNCRMPKGVEFALMYGINAKAKKRFKIKDVSYRKSLAEWMQLINTIYPPNSKINIPSYIHTNLKSPSGDLGVTTGNRKQFPFPKLKTGNNNFSGIFIPLLFSRRGLSYKRSRGGYNLTLHKTSNSNAKIISFNNNLKIYQNVIPFPKRIFACTHQIFTIWFHFCYQIISDCRALSTPYILFAAGRILQKSAYYPLLTVKNNLITN